MDEKGIIKYVCHWEEDNISEDEMTSELSIWRDLAHQSGYIGVYPNGIGFGNISCRLVNGFLISASMTGHQAKTTAEDYSWVFQWNISYNELWCKGLKKASSESLTHAVIYDVFPKTKFILHIHHAELWKKYYDILPSTAPDIEYGTPEMAFSVKSLLKTQFTDSSGIFLMKGHEDGLVCFGENPQMVFDQIAELSF